MYFNIIFDRHYWGGFQNTKCSYYITFIEVTIVFLCFIISFLKTNRKEKHEKTVASAATKTPFFSDDFKETESMSITQMLGLCSGKFNDDNDGKSSVNLKDTPSKKEDIDKSLEMTESYSLDYSNKAMSFDGIESSINKDIEGNSELSRLSKK